ncbi:Hyoscyamine 6-dioxygenase [Actinidia chinensis var. chinensis]|uniref:Hyoscyamine 6-dioxygenase n=1 Tax=Actinidia chinensis var. chinensis TaxID=1590841 RepID=A0A2R6QSC3_ACTCC|nr:Hyoscyamine 6-dioxygenase [Actinidia chinensis var. chinensis]
MSVLLSNWSKHAHAVPASYVLQQEKRPKNLNAVCKSIPVIDLGQLGGPDRADVLQQIMKACQDFGIFQVINHGVSEELMEDTMSLFKEFFDMPAEEKAEYYSEDRTKTFRLYTSGLNYNKDDVNFWKDSVRHLCHPLEDYVQSWPEKPARYREVVGAYAVEVRKLSMRILDLICEGLGIKVGYFGNEISKVQGFIVNHYPPCPDPSLVLGIGGHCDPNLLTLLQQDVHGLQIFKDGQWAGVEPLPHAFVINVCNQLEVVSNGKLKSAEHRAVTNTSVARTSLVTFISPSMECVIEPAKAIASESSPPLFRSYQYKEFHEIFMDKAQPKNTAVESLKLRV